MGLIPRIEPQSNHSQTAPFSLIMKGDNMTIKKEVSETREAAFRANPCIPFSLPLSSGSTTRGVVGRTRICAWNHNGFPIHRRHFCRGVSQPTTQGGLVNDCFSDSSHMMRTISPRTRLEIAKNWPHLVATSTFVGNVNRGSGSIVRKSSVVYGHRTERRSASVMGSELWIGPWPIRFGSSFGGSF